MQVTIASQTHTDWSLDPTIPVEIRVFALQPYTSADGTPVSASPARPGIRSRLTWSVGGPCTVAVAASGAPADSPSTITIPAVTVESTLDAISGPGATLSAVLFRTDTGAALGPYSIFGSFVVPATAQLTWEQLASVNVQPPGFVLAPFFFKGPWNNQTQYLPGNCVQDGGSTWIAINPSTNSEPSLANANWSLVAASAQVSSTQSALIVGTAGAAVTGGVEADALATPQLTLGPIIGQGTVDVQTPATAAAWAEVLLVDSAGNVVSAISRAGLYQIYAGLQVTNGLSADKVTLGVASAVPDPAGSALIEPLTDANGNVLSYYDQQGNWNVAGLVVHNTATTASGAPLVPVAPLPPENLTPSAAALSNLTAATMNVFLGMGQSLANGYISTPAISLVQKYNNVMFNNGVREGTDGSVIQGSQVLSLVPLVEATSASQVGTGAGEQDGETIMAGATDQISVQTMKRGVKVPNAAAVVAWSGQAYAQMAKGTTTYNSLLNCATTFTGLKAGSICRGLFLMHGESDEQNLNTSYEANLVTWQANLNADINAQMGTNVVIPMYLSQIQSWGLYNHATPTTTLSMLSAVKDNPTLFRMVGPKYFLPYVDSLILDDGNGLHLSNVGERIIGEYYGKAAMWDLLAPDTTPWTGLRPKPNGLTLVGRSVLIDFYVPVGPLAIDTLLVSEPTIPGSMYGFEFTDGTAGPPTIVAVEIVGPSSVLLTLSAAPNAAGPIYVSYAYTAVAGQGAGPLMGPRGNLRDSDTTPALYDGRPLYNWCCTFHEQVTA